MGILILTISLIISSSKAWATPLTLDIALSAAQQANPDIRAAKARSEAERFAIRSQSWLGSPRLGFMREQNMTLMEVQDGAMTTWSVSQEVKFPTKYRLLGSAQSARADQADQEFEQKRLEVRSKLISAYFELYAVDRVTGLLKAQKETLREIARIAESRYATGATPQQDQMKAHVEQTKLEKEIFMVEEEYQSMLGMLNAQMGREANEKIELPARDLSLPKLTISTEKLPDLIRTHARRIKQAEFALEEARIQKDLAKWSYAPDMMLSYRRPFGDNATPNAYSAGIEFTIPLWFFAKETSEINQASARTLEAEKNLEKVRLESLAGIQSLVAKVRSSEKILNLYETGLIPQSTSTLNSSQASYRAGRTQFLDLLDSERSLYEVQIAYYRALAGYIENLAKLEELVGHSLSTLPFEGRP